jgi:hypothetical protein
MIPIPAHEWFILGMIAGAAALCALVGLYRLCMRLADIHFERRAKKREMRDAIDQLEDHANWQ